jgi:hypothetical protein
MGDVVHAGLAEPVTGIDPESGAKDRFALARYAIFPVSLHCSGHVVNISWDEALY